MIRERRPRPRAATGCLRGTLFGWLLALCVSAPAQAAPLDALLAVDPAPGHGWARLEASADFVNGAIDVFGLRNAADEQRGLGDYSGAHLRGGGWITPRLWLEGGIWKRSIAYGPDKPRIDSHQLAAQYLLIDPAESRGRQGLAIRLGYWGDRSALLRKSTPSTLTVGERSLTVDEVSVSGARDHQWQADLIGAWPLGRTLTLNAFVGAGTGRVSIGGISVRRGELTATNAGGCSDTIDVGGFEFDDLIPVDGEACYRARSLQAGFNLRWSPNDAWSLAGGYSVQRLSRDRVDVIVESRGGTAYRVAHTLVGQVTYKVAPAVRVFGRGQLMSGPFLGEVPFLYNSITANRFGRAYGIASLGVIVEF